MDGRTRGGSFGGLSMKTVTLILLTFQNSALILIMHYSRIMPPVKGQHRYFTSTAVFLNEVIKLGISLSLALNDVSKSLPSSTPATTLFVEVFQQVFTGDSWKLAVPAMLYTLQNSLQYIAVGNLDAATFQVTYQLKILATAIFSVVMLKRILSPQKWLSLLLLMVGVAVVQIPTGSGNAVPTMKDLREGHTGWRMPRTVEEMRDLGSVAAGQLLSKRSATYEGIEEDFTMHNPQLNASLGLASAIFACVLSGLAGVYFEKVLKDSGSHVSLWIRNVQLSFYSLFPALFIGVMFKDGADISKYGFLVGYNWVVWTAVAFQAVGGVMVSLVVNYADNIAKNFATSISIILSFLVSVLFFDFKITFSASYSPTHRSTLTDTSQYLLGTAIVLSATYLYTLPDSSQRPPPISIAEYEKSSAFRSQASYFDLEKTNSSKLDTPRVLGLTSSRPNTPTYERRHASTRSSDVRMTKRDE
ncbi:UDP-galactose transporter [Sphaceloma murrayae]|uniref:UDP-galactose transporter n=1 Tax=Sphaceloma murrayae TaxID=2082308 RepID=A0A2K1R1P5_9PEZI|nr:UDP-galactose transporter [Sphaceloma murrayae]